MTMLVPRPQDGSAACGLQQVSPPPPRRFLIHKDATAYHPEFMFCGECTTCDEDTTTIAGTDLNLNLNHSDLNMTRHVLLVENLTCPSQVLDLSLQLKELPGVIRVMIKLHEQSVFVDATAETSKLQLCQRMNQMGYVIMSEKHDTTTTPKQQKIVKSSLFVKGICCASECPSVKKILKQLEGVSKIQINITTKVVYVHHDVTCIQATDLVNRLTKQGFPSTIIKDGNELQSSSSSVVVPVLARTTLNVDGTIMTEHDVSTIQQFLSPIQGVEGVAANVMDSVVCINHNVNVVSATRLSQLLMPLYSNSIISTTSTEIQHSMNNNPSAFFETTLLVSNLTLQHVPIMERAIQQHYVATQIRAFHPHVPSKTIKVQHNPTLLQATTICQLLERYGMAVTIHRDGAVENLALPMENPPIHGGMQQDDSSRIHINVLLSGVFWVISLLTYIGGEWENLKYAGLFSVVFGMPPVIAKAWRTLKRCEFDANCMMVVAAFGALALQEYDEAASVSFLFAVSEYLESRATLRSRKALGAIIALRPEHCNILHPITRELAIVPADKVPVGSLIAVRTGDKIAADGVVVEGTSSIDESSLTGEALPVLKRPDDVVAGGSINVGDSQLVIRTTSSVDDSAVSRLIRLVEEAQANRSPTEKLVDAFARRYTPAVMLLATIMCTLPWLYGREVGRYWTLNGLIIIVIACPCALTISTPVTYAAGLAATAQRGVIVKGGANLEALGSVQKVIFDKTGTLTNGKFVLSHLQLIGNAMTRSEMLGLLALIESSSSHPLSATLVMAAKAEGVPMPREKLMVDHTVIKGEGVQASIDGKFVYAGNRRLFERLGLYDSLQSYKALTEGWSRNGGTVGFLGVEGFGIVGAFSVSDAVRPEAKDVIRQLTDEGIEVIMLTGDSEGAAKAVARQVGLPDSAVHSQLLPEDKLHYVGSLIEPPVKRCSPCAKKRLVLMCGDGINDAPALAVADVGVAMGEGAAVAMEMSDITLMDSNLSKLLYTIKMGSRVVATIQENIMLSLVAKLLVVGLTFAGKMTLLSAIASDVGVMLIVTLNGMKLLPSRGREKTRRIDMKQRYNEVVPDVPDRSEIV